ncbi:sucrose transport protein SUC3-like [Arachis stenosperma]|uniref:sucrose transport protein SUC3-like n=1 Tax=Arachis stenosperma TaxID=217475 RepID=UPI0025ACFBD8|nr:sucrose transport protein SUC3-like [Arachis stenosperma]XP_057756014.1 sucrose transport protein SUC3-like [Arachis stenosperma]
MGVQQGRKHGPAEHRVHGSQPGSEDLVADHRQLHFHSYIGYLFGDTSEHCSTFKDTRTRGALVFILGFWMLDLANNTLHRWFPFLTNRACCEACAILRPYFLLLWWVTI